MKKKKDNIFENETLTYRINGFAHACRMDDLNFFSEAGILFNTLGINNHKNEEFNDKPGYVISINKDEDKKKNYHMTIKGQYDDLSFMFINYFTTRILNQKIHDIPFYISLFKKIDDYTYSITIETIKNEETKFTIKKYREMKNETISSKNTFYANILDFSKILKLVKSFVYNPELVFQTYSELVEQKKIVFSTNSINKAIMEDDKLDKPCGKIMKLIKKIKDTK